MRRFLLMLGVLAVFAAAPAGAEQADEPDPCTIEGSTLAWRECVAQRSAAAEELLWRYLADYPREWPPPQRSGFSTLVRKLRASTLTQSVLINPMGSDHGADVAFDNMATYLAFLDLLWSLEQTPPASGKAADTKQVLEDVFVSGRSLESGDTETGEPSRPTTDANVRRAYAELMKQCCEYPITKCQVRQDQSAWTAYRQAWLALAAQRWPRQESFIKDRLNASRKMVLDETEARRSDPDK